VYDERGDEREAVELYLHASLMWVIYRCDYSLLCPAKSPISIGRED
jgi:hypothetical protein